MPRSLRFIFHLGVTLLSCIIIVACSETPNIKVLEDGTEAMAARLDSIAKNVQPRMNEYANRARVELLKSNPIPPGIDRRIQFQGTLAQELVYAGQTEEAIEILNSVLQELETEHTDLLEKYERSIVDLLAFSYLRLGEQQNCLINHSADSCLFPIRGEGVHSITEGSEKAMEMYRRILQTWGTDNMEARWLLNIAYMTLGRHPDDVPEQWLIPPDVFESDYEISRFPDIALQAGLADEMSLSGGSITEDFNRNGFIDIIASSWGLSDPLRYFENNGEGRFIDKTEEAGLTGIVGGLNLRHADFNNDGYADVLVLRGAWLGEAGLHPNSLLRNNGDGTFSDITESAGLLSFHPTQTAVWADFNNDGWLDLFIGNESTGEGLHPSEFYLSNRDGTFTQASEQAGVDVIGFIKGVTAGDFNNDGLQDLYISRLGRPNILFRNDGPENDNGGIPRFTDVTESAGVAEPVESFPVWFWDYNNNGWLDLFVSGYYATAGDVANEYLGKPHKAELPRLYQNNGDGTFTDITRNAGMDKVLYTMGSNYGDLDNDGYPDFYVGSGDPDMRTIIPNRMFRNNAGREFQEVTASGGFGHLQKGHGVSFADLNNNGSQDIFTVIGGALEGDVYMNALFHNPGTDNHKWVTLLFKGEESNRAGIGNRIKIDINTPDGSREIHEVVSTGSSFGSSSLQQEIGLGDATSIRRIEVFWPASGTTQVFENTEMNRFYRITENSDRLEPVERTRFEFDTGGSQTHQEPVGLR
ncbi:MAG: CRTAC1 family protein [Balneolaceae bacterium]